MKLITAYMTDIVTRWHGRPAKNNEVARALDEEPATDLEAPNGHLAIAYGDDEAVGLGGMRFIDHRTAELTKVFTLPHARGRGVGSAVLGHLEALATELGLPTIRLDTRSDLVEACRMYERRGYHRVAPFSESKYSDRWYQLRLRS